MYFDNEHVPQIDNIECYTDDEFVYGFRVNYSGGLSAPKHMAYGNTYGVGTARYNFSSGEYITKVTGKTGYYVD